jgi:cytochrome c553
MKLLSRMKTVSFVLLGLAFGAVAAEPSPKNMADFEWPAETGAYKPGKGSELAQALCMNCHSVEYVSTQPPMPRKFWEGVLKKMKEKYAAPMPDDMTALADYLTDAYGVK